jgi:type VI secretion system protein ImpF
MQRGYTVQQMMDVVRRDLEELLNTHRPPQDLFEGTEECPSSIVNYGVPDVTSYDAATDDQKHEIAHLITTIINTFEPRLIDVQVTLAEDRAARQIAKLNYRINGRLYLDPYPPVVFDTMLDLAKGRTEVKSSEA